MMSKKPLDRLDSLGAGTTSGGPAQDNSLEGKKAPASAASIFEVAAALGLDVSGRNVSCFNARAHKCGHDHHPSLVLFPNSNSFKCMACGVHGDVIDFVRGVQGVGFGDAVKWIEKNVSVASGAITQRSTRRACAADELAAEVYAALFEQTYEIGPDMPAGRYLLGRGLNLDLINEHHVTQIGSAQDLWAELCEEFGQERLQAAGLMSERGNFLFSRHELLFFYFDNGQPRYVQARDITGNVACKELMPKGVYSPVPFNFDLLGTHPSIIHVCEGCIDTLSAIQIGYPAVGVPGVQGFKKEWYELFVGVEHVRFLFDNDEAGFTQAQELVTQFKMRGFSADARHPKGVKDMNDLLKRKMKGGAK
jgi:DNA primase